METSLHRQLKELYADDDSQTEVQLGDFRIDAIFQDQLVEIQHGSLAAIRDKIKKLLVSHRVMVVKPIILRKQLVKCSSRGGPVVDRRRSPRSGSRLDLFDELVYFTRVFPHRNLVLETPLIDIEEWRYPGHGKRRRHRKNDFQVEDRRLTNIHETLQYKSASDLLRLVPTSLPTPFHTGHLAKSLDVPRWNAQRIAYCLRETGAICQVGKEGNTRLYRKARRLRKRRRKVA